MAKPKLNKAVTCTVGASRGGITELIGPGAMIYVTPETRVEPGTELQTGHKVLVDYRLDPQTFGGQRGMLAERVRNLGPDATDVRELQELLERLARAGLGDPGFGEPSQFLGKLFDDRLAQGRPGRFR